MTAKTTTLWKKGKSGNPNGRPRRGAGKPISSLRSTLNKLKALEPKAIDVIEASLNDEDIEKPQVDTAKWIISSIASLTRTAITEESFRSDLREKEEEALKATGTDSPKPIKFSTRLVEGDN